MANDGARTRFDFHRDRHTGREIDELILDLHLIAVERHASRIE